MGRLTEWRRHSRPVIQSKRWPALRLAVLRRDGFRCVACGARGRLEVDHVQPVRTHPERAFDLNNLQALCGRCHGAKTRSECNLPQASPERLAWRDLIGKMERK